MDYIDLCIYLFISCIGAFSANWALNYFGLSGIEQIVFHLKVPLEGTNKEFIKDWFILCFVPSTIITICVFLLSSITQTSFLFIICIILFLLYAIYRVGLTPYIFHQLQKTNLYDDYYVDGKNVEIAFPKQKRNLIHIYVESLETTYTSKENGGNYKDDLLFELSTLAKQEINFSNSSLLGGAYVVNGTGWTTAGMVAQSSGVPLCVPIQFPKFSDTTPFLPGAYGLGDILKKEGYNQTYLIGSNAAFGGRKFYYEKHGDFTIYDYDYAKTHEKIAEDYHVFWGYEDDKLFHFAKEEVTRLANEEKPFNFTMLTVDTHHPYGFKDNKCTTHYKEQLSNIIRENSKKVGAFVDWLKKQSFYENTTIVITGDHLSMAAQYINKTYDKHYPRTIFNTFINTNIKPINPTNRCFTNLDFFPTILASLDATIENERLGLGTNLFSDKKTLAEQIGLQKLNNELVKQSKYYHQKILGSKCS